MSAPSTPLPLLLVSLCSMYHVTSSAPYKEVCYTGLGCYNTTSPTYSISQHLPQDPTYLRSQIRLSTRQTLQSGSQYELLDYLNVTSRSFSSSKVTKVIIHGFRNGGDDPWVVQMRDALITKDDVNVIVVDWKKAAFHDSWDITVGSLDPRNYWQAIANIPLLATQMVQVLQGLQTSQGLNLTSVHLIGHSLGAHMSGVIGRMMGGQIGRISGLDPAAPSYEHASDYIRLDKTDAMFVDVIHTAMDVNRTDNVIFGRGLMQQLGHVDIYANGGATQPGCGGFLHPDIICSHNRATDYFTASIHDNCQLVAYPCTSYEKFQQGQCFGCGPQGCSYSGYPMDPQSPSFTPGPKYMATKPAAPFCGAAYHVYFDVHDKVVNITSGTIEMSLAGPQGQTEWVKVTAENQQMTGNTVVSKVVVLSVDLDPVTTIKVKYTREGGFLLGGLIGHGKPYIKMAALHVAVGRTGKRFTTCKGEYNLMDKRAEWINATFVDSSTSSSCFNMGVVG